MASAGTPTPSGDKVARVVDKLSRAVAEKDYYGALQMYRTVVQRKFDGGDVPGGTHLLVLGARTLAAAGKYMECFDLGDMLLKVFSDAARQLSLNSFTAAALLAVLDSVTAQARQTVGRLVNRNNGCAPPLATR